MSLVQPDWFPQLKMFPGSRGWRKPSAWASQHQRKKTGQMAWYVHGIVTRSVWAGKSPIKISSAKGRKRHGSTRLTSEKWDATNFLQSGVFFKKKKLNVVDRSSVDLCYSLLPMLSLHSDMKYPRHKKAPNLLGINRCYWWWEVGSKRRMHFQLPPAFKSVWHELHSGP